MTEPTFRRKRILVDKKLQLGMAFQIIGYVYFYLVLFALLANVNALWTVIAGSDVTSVYAAAVERLQIFMEVFVLPLVFTFVCMCLHGILFSHRLAGPIYRFKETLRKMRSGDIAQDIRIRGKDYFQDLCEDMNSVLGGLRTEMTKFRDLSRELADQGEALADTGELPPEAQEKLVRITNASTQLRQAMDCYRIDEEDIVPKEAEAPTAEEPEEASV